MGDHYLIKAQQWQQNTGVNLDTVTVKKVRKDGKYNYVYNVTITESDKYVIECEVNHMLLIHNREDYEYDREVYRLTLDGNKISMQDSHPGVVAMMYVIDDLAYLIRNKAFNIERTKLFNSY